MGRELLKGNFKVLLPQLECPIDACIYRIEL